MAHPATEKRGGNPDVKHKTERQKPKDAMERKLEQGLEESMTGSDPVSVTQPPKHHEKKED
jgi:DNA-directed RNA polymerase subunit L